MTPRLSIITLALNAEDGLERCMWSVNHLTVPFEHIIAVDDRSTDRTLEIAQAGKVHTYTWPDSFSEACNQAFTHASGDYVMRVDADEVLNIPSIIDHLVTSPQFVNFNAFAFNTIHLNSDGKVSIISPTLTRLVKRDMDFRYHGRVHEQLYTGDDPTTDDNIYATIEDPVIVHFGYDPSNYAEKLERNNRLAAMDAWDDGFMLGLYHLARGYAYSGDTDEARKYALMALSENLAPQVREHCMQIAGEV